MESSHPCSVRLLVLVRLMDVLNLVSLRLLGIQCLVLALVSVRSIG